MTGAPPHFLEVARRVLNSNSTDRSATACAGAALAVLEELQKRIIPLIGPAGMRALFARAVKVTNHDFAALAPLRAETLADSPNVSETLSRVLADLEPGNAWAAAAALYSNFLQLTSSLIGERLVLQVLQRGFPKVDVTAKQESE